MSIIATIAGAVIMGGIVGLIPFFLGKKKGFQTLGTVGLLGCILANFLIGLYGSIPVCIVFLIIIAVKKSTPAIQSTPQNTYQGVTGNTYQNTGIPMQNTQISVCPFCGAQLGAGEVYCSSCGRKVK